MPLLVPRIAIEVGDARNLAMRRALRRPTVGDNTYCRSMIITDLRKKFLGYWLFGDAMKTTLSGLKVDSKGNVSISRGGGSCDSGLSDKAQFIKDNILTYAVAKELTDKLALKLGLMHADLYDDDTIREVFCEYVKTAVLGVKR